MSKLKNNSNLVFKLLIAGDGELRSEIQNLILSLQLESNIILLGHRTDIPELISAADLFIISSKYEGFGLVVAEGMACQCLVVCTECGGVAEIIEHNVSGLIVEKENKEELANTLLKLMNLAKADYQKMSSQTSFNSEQYSVQSIVKMVIYYLN